jgi:hypothetical protein
MWLTPCNISLLVLVSYLHYNETKRRAKHYSQKYTRFYLQQTKATGAGPTSQYEQ